MSYPGHQLGRVVSGATQEVVSDLLFAGNVQLNTALRSLVAEAEEVLSLDRWRRSLTVLRMDSGGGSLDDLNWCLARGYQLQSAGRGLGRYGRRVVRRSGPPGAAGRVGRPRGCARLRPPRPPPRHPLAQAEQTDRP